MLKVSKLVSKENANAYISDIKAGNRFEFLGNTYEYKNITIVPDNICDKCGGNITLNYIEGISICLDCGEQYNILIDSYINSIDSILNG